ncbi:MAG TPA: hypothetical protein VFX30_13975 [bacterium]|nr:hypothetical protein [bacterium]
MLSVTPFLLPGVSAQAALQERALLGELSVCGTVDTFQVGNRLQELYRRNLKKGGLAGSAWLSSVLAESATRVEEEGLYGHFLEFRGDQEAVLRLPSAVAPPPGFRLSDEIPHPAVIALETSRALFAHKPFYFSLSGLFFEEGTVRLADVAEARDDLAKRLRGGVPVIEHYRSGQRLVRTEAARCHLLLESGHSYVLGWKDGQDVFREPPFRAADLKIDTCPPKPREALNPIPPASFTLGFTPRRDGSFAPRVVTLVRQGQPYPVVIEEQDFDGLIALAPPEAAEELKSYRSRNGLPRLLMAFRSAEGTLDGFCVNTLSQEDSSLFCDRSFKIVRRNPQNEILYFGLAVTMARLQFLKESGRWRERGEALTNFTPWVTSYYRSLVSLPQKDRFSLGAMLDTITFPEGEQFLIRNPLSFERLG